MRLSTARAVKGMGDLGKCYGQSADLKGPAIKEHCSCHIFKDIKEGLNNSMPVLRQRPEAVSNNVMWACDEQADHGARASGKSISMAQDVDEQSQELRQPDRG